MWLRIHPGIEVHLCWYNSDDGKRRKTARPPSDLKSPSTPQLMEVSAPSHKMCYETSMNKTYSPLTSEIIGTSPPSLPSFEVSAPTPTIQLTHPTPKEDLYFSGISVKFQKDKPMSLKARIFIKANFWLTRTTRTPASWGYPPPSHDYPYYWFILDPRSNKTKSNFDLLKLLDQMCKYVVGPSSIAEDTVR